MKIRRRTTIMSLEPTAEDVATVEAILARGGDIAFGAPTRCPRCGNFGSVERADSVRSEHRCPVCDHEWRVVRAALKVARRATVTRTGPIGNGLLIRDLHRTAMPA